MDTTAESRLEQLFLSICSDVASREIVRADLDLKLADIDIDSLGAFDLAGRIERATGVEVDIRRFAQSNSLGEILIMLRNGLRSAQQ